MPNLQQLILITLLFLLPTSSYAKGDVVGHIEYLKGDVAYAHHDTWQKAALQQPLQEGDHVRTGETSRLRVRFVDGSTMQLGEKAEAIIQRYKTADDMSVLDSLLELVQGRARFIVEKINRKEATYHIESRAVLIGVRGTDILLQSQSDTADVALAEGSIDIHSQKGSGSLRMQVGEYSQVSMGQDHLQRSAIPDPWLTAFMRDVGSSQEGKKKKKGQQEDDSTPPANMLQQQTQNRTAFPTVIPR